MPANVCVIGYGLSAKVFHIPYILLTPGLHLHSILQRNPTPENDAARDHPGVKVHPSLEAVCADPEIRLVIVGTSNAQHYPMAKALLEAGKDVAVEKPFTVKPEEGDELCALAKEKVRLLTVFHNRRFDADFLTLRRLIAANTFGQIVSFETHFDRYKAPGAKKDSWKTQAVAGNGILFDLGSHLLDQALTLFGLPDRVFASVRDERQNSSEPKAQWGEDGFLDDAFDAMLFYDSGLVVKLVANATSLCERQIRYIVRGTEAGYVKHGLDLQEDQTKAGMAPSDPKFGVETEEHWGVLTTPQGSKKVKSEDGVYIKWFQNLSDALEGKAEIEVKPEQAANVVRLLTLMGQSSREKRVLDVAK